MQTIQKGMFIHCSTIQHDGGSPEELKTYMKFQMITFHHFSQIERCIHVLQVKPLELITAEAKDM